MKYTKEVLETAVAANTSIIGVLRALRVSETSGGMHYHISKRIKQFGIDVSHFKGTCWNKGKLHIRRPLQQILAYRANGLEKTRALRLALAAAGRPVICEECGQSPTWNNKPLTLQIDHKDGNRQNNIEYNLRYLCPNCHTQTPTYGITKEYIGRELKPKLPKPRKRKINKIIGACKRCGTEFIKHDKMTKYCSRACISKSQEHIVWPDDNTLCETIIKIGYTAVGESLNISTQAIRKRIETRHACVAQLAEASGLGPDC